MKMMTKELVRLEERNAVYEVSGNRKEFGSGGRDIGIRIAKEAQIPYYDGQLLIEAAKGYGIEIATLKEFDENKVGSFLYNIAMMAGYNQYENMAKINEIFME